MSRWTEEQYREHLRRNGVAGAPNIADVRTVPFKLPANTAGRFALGHLPAGKMNKTEERYDKHLWALRQSGVVVWHKFEALKFRLADSTFYTPDFAVLMNDGLIELHEIKGFWEDDARVKIKVAAETFPFRFKALKPRKAGGWDVEEFT